MTNENPRRGHTAGAEVVDQFEQQQHTTPPTTFQSHRAIAARQSAPATAWRDDYPNAKNTGPLTRRMPTIDIDIYNPEVGCRYFGLSSNASYIAAARGESRTVRIGRPLRVPIRALEHSRDRAPDDLERRSVVLETQRQLACRTSTSEETTR